MESLGPVIDQAIARDGIDADGVEALERLRAVLTLVGKRIAAADPFTTYPAPLDGIANAFANAKSEVQNFVANGSIGHVTNANSHADNALANLAAIAVPVTPKELQGLRDATVSYRASLDDQLKKARSATSALVGEVEAAKVKTTDLAGEIATERQRLSDLSSGFQSQFSTAQETRNREYTEAQGTRQDKFAALLTDFTTRLTEQNADFTQQKEAAIKQLDEDAAALKVKYANAGQAVLDEIDAHRKNVEKLVGVIGDLGVTSGYVKVANYARKALWIWQGVAVAAMGGVIYAAAKLFIFQQLQAPFSVESFIGRIIFSLTVAVLAAYAAFQADKYRLMENQNRQHALELAAIGPFLAPLPKDQQDTFRLSIGTKTFGQNGGTTNGHSPDKSPATVLDLVRSPEVQDMLAKMVNAARGS
jgi:predicted  nucleic acid-binding Zn-ribbon protein